MSSQVADRQVVQLDLKPMVRGQLLGPAYKVNVLGHALGLQYKLILILAVIALQQKLTELTMNTLRAARLDVQLELEPMVHGLHMVAASKVNVLGHALGLQQRHA